MMANEKRLIDMDDTMNKLRAYAERKHEAEHYELANGILKAVNYIRNNIVRVNAVEVVRCKDCKRWGVYPDGEDGMCHCLCRCTGNDDFCSYGERRTEE